MIRVLPSIVSLIGQCGWSLVVQRMQGTDQSMHAAWLDGAIMCAFPKGRSSHHTWPAAFGSPTLATAAYVLRPHELAGDMREDIRYGQRIFRLPLSAWWLKLRRAVRGRQSKPSTKLSLATNLTTKSEHISRELLGAEICTPYLHICILFFTNLNIVCNIKPLFSSARRSITWQKCSLSSPCDSSHTLTRLCNANDFLQYHFMSTSVLHSSTRPAWKKERIPKLLFFMLIWWQLARLFSFSPQSLFLNRFCVRKILWTNGNFAANILSRERIPMYADEFPCRHLLHYQKPIPLHSPRSRKWFSSSQY